MSDRPATTSIFAILKRAFGWNLGKVVASQREVDALTAAGITDPAVQQYAVWRRSLLMVAAIWTTISAVLALIDTIEDGFHELTALGVTLEIAWLAVAFGLAGACFIGVLQWKKPGRGSGLLIGAWVVGFLLPFVYALLPVGALYHVSTEPVDPGDTLGKIRALGDLAMSFVMSLGSYLLLLPAVISLIPGAVNGCLRIKSLLPAAQLPGWLLVCSAPLFLLFWIIVLVIVNHLANNMLLVCGFLLWAGAPIWYSALGKVFVQSQIGEAEAARISGVKRIVGITTMIGLALLLWFALSAKVAHLHVFGFDKETAVATKIQEFADADDLVTIDEVFKSFSEAESLVYALDLSNWRLVVDLLAKVLVVTIVFAELILRATVIAWKNDRKFRGGPGADPYNATMSQAATVLGE